MRRGKQKSFMRHMAFWFEAKPPSSAFLPWMLLFPAFCFRVCSIDDSWPLLPLQRSVRLCPQRATLLWRLSQSRAGFHHHPVSQAALPSPVVLGLHILQPESSLHASASAHVPSHWCQGLHFGRMAASCFSQERGGREEGDRNPHVF